MKTTQYLRPAVEPYTSQAGIGWRCTGCGETWSGARGAHRHCHRFDEAEMSDCEFGCKVFRCSCGETEIRHYASYGCPIGRAVVSVSAA